MIIKAIKFKRTKDSDWESGISFEVNGNMTDRVIDMEGNLIPLFDINESASVYDGKDLNHIFCLDLEPILNYIKKEICQ